MTYCGIEQHTNNLIRKTIMTVQPLTPATSDNMILISKADYNALIESHDDIDLIAIAELRRKFAAGEEELIPPEIVHRLLDDENPTRVWRKHRDLTIKALAQMVDVAPTYLSQIETGKRDGTVNYAKDCQGSWLEIG
jgi:Helix-turn-helix